MVDARKATRIYQELSDRLMKHTGKMVAIETDTGDYFVGENAIDACDKARIKHPRKQFFLKRIGAKHAFVVGAQ